MTRKRTATPVVPFDALASETLRLIIKAFLRCGYSPRDIGVRAKAEAARIARRVRPVGNGARIDQDDWARVVTLWSTEPEYVDEDGAPLILRIRGPAPSIEALVRRVESKLTLEEVCNGLLRAGAVRKVGRRLAAEAHPALVYPSGSKDQSAHQLRALNALVWTFEHNSNLNPNAVPWVERWATAQVFPESAVTAYSLEATSRAMAFLKEQDALMQRLASSTKPEGRKVRAHLHVFFSAPQYHPSNHVSAGSDELAAGGTKHAAVPMRTDRRARSRSSGSAPRAARKVDP
ncbi:MAG: hypothetical protein ACJ8R9_05820 [Steroidobacteraceae bacterium]